jgi:hypothetical protein
MPRTTASSRALARSLQAPGPARSRVPALQDRRRRTTDARSVAKGGASRLVAQAAASPQTQEPGRDRRRASASTESFAGTPASNKHGALENRWSRRRPVVSTARPSVLLRAAGACRRYSWSASSRRLHVESRRLLPVGSVLSLAADSGETRARPTSAAGPGPLRRLLIWRSGWSAGINRHGDRR